VGNSSVNDGNDQAVYKISDEVRRLLLRVAREEAAAFLSGTDSPAIVKSVPGDFGGAFVTLWNKDRLRGCVGSFAATSNLVATVQRVTRSTLRDSRFKSCPVTAEELDRLTIEISILTTPTVTDDPASLVPGVDGIVIASGKRTGCFLPKVATDRNWSAKEFLSNCCTMKAGLSADAWKGEDVKVSLFRAAVFSDGQSEV
jgi:uncharacterized protein